MSQFKAKLLIDFFANRELPKRSKKFLEYLSKYTDENINTPVKFGKGRHLPILQFVHRFKHKLDYWFDLFVYLVDNGIDLNVLDNGGRSILYYIYNDINTCNYVLNHPSFNCDSTLLTPYMNSYRFIWKYDVDLYKLMYQKGGKPDIDELIKKIWCDYVEDVVKMLIDDLGVDINYFTPDNMCIFSQLIRCYFAGKCNNFFELMDYIIKKFPSFDINMMIVETYNTTIYGNALFSMTEHYTDSCIKFIEYMMDHGINIRAKNINGVSIIDEYQSRISNLGYPNTLKSLYDYMIEKEKQLLQSKLNNTTPVPS